MVRAGPLRERYLQPEDGLKLTPTQGTAQEQTTIMLGHGQITNPRTPKHKVDGQEMKLRQMKELRLVGIMVKLEVGTPRIKMQLSG